MLANNPHLQKKRSSKKGLGRSLMRRITEIPETMGRQCSREDKDLGEHGSNRNSICVLRKNPSTPHTLFKPAKDESLKSKVFSLKKSHSSYDHVGTTVRIPAVQLLTRWKSQTQKAPFSNPNGQEADQKVLRED